MPSGRVAQNLLHWPAASFTPVFHELSPDIYFISSLPLRMQTPQGNESATVDRAEKALFGDFRGILSRAEIEFAEEEKDSGSEVVEGTEAARIGLDGLDA